MPGPDVKYGGVSSGAVCAKTGKGWDEWSRVLDGESAAELSHQEIARLLFDSYNVPAWWCQKINHAKKI